MLPLDGQVAEALEDQPTPPSTADLDALRERIIAIAREGAIPARKALLRALVHEVIVRGRDDIRPVFRVPADSEEAKVREQTGLVGPTDHNTNLIPLIAGPTIALPPLHAKVRRDGYRPGG